MGEMLSSAADSSFPRHMKGQKIKIQRAEWLSFYSGEAITLIYYARDTRNTCFVKANKRRCILRLDNVSMELQFDVPTQSHVINFMEVRIGPFKSP